MMTDFGNQRLRVPVAEMAVANNMKWMGQCVKFGSTRMWKHPVVVMTVFGSKRWMEYPVDRAVAAKCNMDWIGNYRQCLAAV